MSLPRRIATLVATVTAAAAVIPAVAQAGGYDVHACDAGVAGGANNAFAASADGGTTAYTSCPAGQGLVARNVYDNGQSSWLQGAYMFFDAPPATIVESISFQAGWRRHDCSWGTTIVASGGDLGGNVVWGYPAGQLCDYGQIPSDTDFFPTRFSASVNAPRVRIETRCGAAVCARNGVATMRLKDVIVHVRDDVAPTLKNGRGALWTASGWLAGNQAIGFDATDGAGIASAEALIDGQQARVRSLGCDYTQRAPCPQGGLDATIPTSAWSDGDHTLTLRAVDAAGNPAAVDRVVHIDNTPPDPPQNLAVDGGDGWRSTNDFTVRWTTQPAKTGAPVAGAEWDLCPLPGGDCNHGRQDGAITSLGNLKLPAPGAYTLKLWLRDAAGNQDARLAAPPVTLRYDDASPDLAFEPLSADDPTLLTVDTSDRGSGVTGGQISLRPQGAADWTPIPTEVAGGRMTARLDDLHLRDGVYELAATATDAAGNQRTTQTRTDGNPATITLPLRLKTRMRAGVVRRVRGRTRLARSAVVHYGQLVRVRGRLSTPEHNPMQGVTVQAYTQIADRSAPPRLIAAVKTSRTGRFSFLVRRGPSRTIRIVYDGGPQIRNAIRVLSLNVRSKTSIRPDHRRLVNGETVTFHGRIKTGRIPSTGKLVEMQVHVRGRWRTFATTRASRRGLWRLQYRFDGTVGSVTYRFRAVVPPETSYPFAPGHSRVVRVRVRGM